MKIILSFFIYGLFIFGLILGVGISILRRSWLGVWVGLELNIIRVIPILSYSNQIKREVGIKYFLIQSCGSFLLLFRGLNLLNSIRFILGLRIALLIKIGAAPFHFWFPNIAESVNWFQLYLLRTLQKLSPLVLLFYSLTKDSKVLIILSILIRGAIGAVGGINEMFLRKILAFSSINHLGWILIPLLEINRVFLVYFLIYCILILRVFFLLNRLEVFHLNQLYRIRVSVIRGVRLFVRILSLGGIPPLIGFFPKWILLQEIASIGGLFCIYFILCSSVITLFFYIRLGVGILFLIDFSKPIWSNFKLNLVSIGLNRGGLVFLRRIY